MTISKNKAPCKSLGQHRGSSENDDSSDSDIEIFSLATKDLWDGTGKLSVLLNEFCNETPGIKSRYPPMVLLLQHFEIFLSNISIKATATRVSNYFVQQRKNTDDVNTFVDATSCLYRDLRRIIGAKQFDSVSRMLRDGGSTMALGLAPSLYLRSTNCSKCKARRCLHLFCPECGLIFDIKAETCKEMGIALIDIETKKVDICSKLAKKAQELKPKYEFPVKSEENKKPNIKRTRIKRDMRSRCDRAGMAGIQELFKSVKDERYLMTFGGDVLLLLRNLAVTATGEPKDLAISCFQQVCARWMQGHGEVGIIIPDAHDSDNEEIEDKKRESVVKDTAEGLYVVSKMLNTDTKDSRVLLRRGRDTPEEVCHKLFPGLCKREVKAEVAAACATASTDDSHADQTNEEEEDYIEFAGVRRRGSPAISMPDKSVGGIPLVPTSSSSPPASSTAPSLSLALAVPPDAYSSSSWGSRGITTVSAFDSANSSATGQGLGQKPEKKVVDRSSRAVRELYDEDGNIISIGPDADLVSAADTHGARPYEDIKKRKRSEEETVTDSATGSSSSSSSSSSGSSSSTSSDAQLPRAAVSVPVSVPKEFSEAAFLMKEILSHHIHMFHGTLIDFIPTRSNGKKRALLPVSKVVQCGECGSMESNKGRSACNECKTSLAEHLDYSSVLDTLLWSYFFTCIQVPTSHVFEGYCKDVMQLLPLIRSYQERADLGSEFFKWQCYFATHVVYFFSDYGQQALSRQLFSEEFRLIAMNLDYVCTNLKDVELAGEFVQCLKILQYTEEADPELEPMMTSALKFLLARGRDKEKDKEKEKKKERERERERERDKEKERERGSSSSSSSSTAAAAAVSSANQPVIENEYDRRYKAYHTSYCAAIGLVDYEFLQNEETRLNPPVPGIFKLCDSYVP